MPVDDAGTITIDGTADGTLTILKLEELQEFDETEVFDLPQDAVRMMNDTEQTILALLTKADIDIDTVNTTGVDAESLARQDQLKRLAGHCVWIDILSLEVVNLDDQGFKAKRDYHLERKKWFISLYLGLDAALRKKTDPTLITTDPPTVTGGLRFVGVR